MLQGQVLATSRQNMYFAMARAVDRVVRTKSGPVLLAEINAQSVKAVGLGCDVTVFRAIVARCFNIGAVPPIPTTVTFVLDVTTPVADTVNPGQNDVDVLHFNVSSVPYVPVLTSIAFTRQGFAADTDIGNVYLVRPDATFSVAVINPVTHQAVFSPVGLAQTGVWELHVDVAAGAVVGHVFRFDLLDPTDVVPALPSTTVAGVFPVTGNLFTVVAVPVVGGVFPIGVFFG